jgi:hypothetical protein
MKHPYKISILAGLVIAAASSVSAQVTYSKRTLVDESTGYLESYVAGDWYRGSGVIVRDPKLIYSCGHLFYENGVWATDYIFYRAYHKGYSPDPAEGAPPRGFRYFTTYSNNVEVYGGNSARAFAYDFTVFYGTEPFGTAVGWWSDGGQVLRSERSKRIVGYPSRIEYTGAPGYYYQHATDWFSKPASQTQGAYHSFSKVSTGTGNSGGPVFVWEGGDYYLGGILVSGSDSTAGVYALNDSSHSMASAALGLKSLTRTFGNTDARLLPDASSTYVTRATTASGFSETITGLKFNLSVATQRRGDLDIYLRSPTGRIRWVNKQSTDSADNVELTNADYTGRFRGYAPNGTWKLKMRDAVAGTRARFNGFSVTVTALGK